MEQTARATEEKIEEIMDFLEQGNKVFMEINGCNYGFFIDGEDTIVMTVADETISRRATTVHSVSDAKEKLNRVLQRGSNPQITIINQRQRKNQEIKIQTILVDLENGTVIIDGDELEFTIIPIDNDTYNGQIVNKKTKKIITEFNDEIDLLITHLELFCAKQSYIEHIIVD